MRQMIRGALLAAALAGSASAAPLTQDNFLVRNTADFVALCDSAPSDALYTPAQNFCHGFAVGAFRTLMDAQKGMRKKLFCEPAQQMTRSEHIAAFVKWAGPNPTTMAMPATDAILKFLSETYPCK